MEKESPLPDPSYILSIHYGLYSGECIGYCVESIVIEPKTIVYTQRSNIASDELPDRVLETAAHADLWERLSRALDWNTISAYPDRLGDPDAADQGGEYIEIRTSETAKRVDLERGAAVSGLDPVLEILRNLRSDLASQIES